MSHGFTHQLVGLESARGNLLLACSDLAQVGFEALLVVLLKMLLVVLHADTGDSRVFDLIPGIGRHVNLRPDH